MVEHRAVAFRNRLQLCRAGRRTPRRASGRCRAKCADRRRHRRPALCHRVRVVVVPRGGQAQPREARQALTLGEHVGSDARLPRHQGLRQQIALQLRDARPVLHIAVIVRRFDAAVLARQTRDGALQVADGREMLFDAQPRRPWADLFLSAIASSRTASRMLRLRFTQPSSRSPNRRSNSLCGSISGGSGRS